MLCSVVAFALYFGTFAWASPDVLWEGRAPFNYTADDINISLGPYLNVVKGKHKASYYFRFLSYEWYLAATPIWPEPEQPISIFIDKTSVFTPTGSAPQSGFRRSELIAQSPEGGNRTAFNEMLESDVTAFHFSVYADTKRPLNYTHEYQAVFVEKPDGSHVFDLQTGTPFNTTASSSTSTTTPTLRIRAHDGTVLFHTPFPAATWHNFAIIVDWSSLTLQVFYSLDADPLEAVTKVQDNSSAGRGPQGQGDFHFGVLKLPLINPSDTPAEQADVVHFGIQERLHEALLYSGLFVERAHDSVSIGNEKTSPV